MTDRKMNVDLTDEETMTEPQVEETPDEPETVDAAVGDSPMAEDDGSMTPKEVARRLLDRADNPSDALDGAQEALQRHLKQYEKCNNHLEEQRSRIDSLEETADRVKELPDDALCLQTLEGGISTEVKPDDDVDDGDYSRSDLLDDIDEAIEARKDLIDGEKERLERLEAECATIRKAAADIENLKELTGDTMNPEKSAPPQGGQPADDRWPEN